MKPKFKLSSDAAMLLTMLVLSVAMQLGSAAVQAQSADVTKSYPAKPIRIIVPFPPGGGADIIGRFIGQKLTNRLGQQIVIDNRGGGDGIIATDLTARALPDGYTLLVVSTTYAMSPAMHKQLPYDPLKSFTAISAIATGQNLLAVWPGLTVNSIKELIALAKSKPGQLRYASSGTGTYFGGEQFKLMAGIDLLHIPYKGGGPAMLDVMSGQVEVLFNTVISALAHIRSGRLKALGVDGAKRSSVLPDVPTVAEGGLAGYEGSIWWGITGPAFMPVGIVNRLNTEIANVLRDPESVKWLAAQAAEPMIASPDTFGKLIANDVAKWTKVAREAGIMPQ